MSSEIVAYREEREARAVERSSSRIARTIV